MKIIGQDFIRDNQKLFRHKKCVFVVGAGISVPSGIPDFRSPTGIFATLRQKLKTNGTDLFTYNFGVKEGTRAIYLKYIAELKKMCEEALPNQTHHFLRDFPGSRIYTQNIDGLEERSGVVFTKSQNTKGVYLHGNLSILKCQYCGYKQSFDEEQRLTYEKTEEIVCSSCRERREISIKNKTRPRPVGVMHPGIIHYQQVHPDGAFISKMAEKDRDCDMLIVIGTSLKVEGVKRLVKMFSKGDRVKGKRMYVNLTPPSKEWSDVFDYYYEGDCVDFVSAVEMRTKTCAGDDSAAKESISNNSENSNNDNSNNSDNDNNSDNSDRNEQKCPAVVEPLILIGTEALRRTAPVIIELEENGECKMNDMMRRVSISREDDERMLLKAESSERAAPRGIEELSRSFDQEDLIASSVLNEAVSGVEPVRIEEIEDRVQTSDLKDSSCADLQEEFESIVEEESGKKKERLSIAFSPAKPRNKKKKSG